MSEVIYGVQYAWRSRSCAPRLEEGGFTRGPHAMTLAKVWCSQLIREIGRPPHDCAFELCSRIQVDRGYDERGTGAEVRLRASLRYSDDEPAIKDYVWALENSSPEWDDQSINELIAAFRVPRRPGVCDRVVWAQHARTLR